MCPKVGRATNLQLLPAHDPLLLEIDLVGDDNHGELLIALLADLNKERLFPML